MPSPTSEGESPHSAGVARSRVVRRATSSKNGDMAPSPDSAATVPDRGENSSGDDATGTATSSPLTQSPSAGTDTWGESEAGAEGGAWALLKTKCPGAAEERGRELEPDPPPELELEAEPEPELELELELELEPVPVPDGAREREWEQDQELRWVW
ncbi:hypothetical protein AAFF_G00109960 [Aldrovandia affinis]|uniref:Uncharacterized protein n=1 Tax=Aldrovandia affinis TaxID=143900 RepID=A0AAD7RTL1_9TELE|nr:hypothetical protein AAFF_G00109960 [Aldrovandia affinis]